MSKGFTPRHVTELEDQVRAKAAEIAQRMIDNNPDGTTDFEHSERFSGLLVGVMSKTLDRDTKPGFENMNEKLKERVEALWQGMPTTAKT